MIRVRASPAKGLRVILCMKFIRNAAFNEVASFKRSLIAHDKVLHSVEVSGSFDFMVEAEHADLTSYQEMLDDLASRFGHLIEHYEASFVCRRYLREADDSEGTSHHLWVPTSSGLRRVDHDRIDKVTAEGDYVRIQSGTSNWLLHATMHSVLDQLGTDRFLRLNRSTIVRTEFVERLIHDYRRWTARLFDGTDHPIAKSRSAQIVARLKSDSSAGSSDPGADGDPNEPLIKLTEKPVQ